MEMHPVSDYMVGKATEGLEEEIARLLLLRKRKSLQDDIIRHLQRTALRMLKELKEIDMFNVIKKQNECIEQIKLVNSAHVRMARYQREIDELSIQLCIHNSNHAIGKVEMSDEDDDEEEEMSCLLILYL